MEEVGVKNNKKGMGIVIVVIVIAAILAFLILPSIVNKKTFSSESEMRSAVEGTYNGYEKGKLCYQLKIVGDKAIKHFVGVGSEYDVDLKIYSWNPKNGTLDMSLGTATVNKNGDLDYNGCIYKKEGAWTW